MGAHYIGTYLDHPWHNLGIRLETLVISFDGYPKTEQTYPG